MTVDTRAILDFWFGAGDARRPEWFRKDEAFDAQIRARFGAPVEAALAADAAGVMGDAPSALAQVLLLDQFTRNIFRGTPRAFAGDAKALVLARTMVARGDDLALPPLRRLFVYVPFEHSEDIGMHQESLRLFAALSTVEPACADFEDYARRHAVIVERFGRFPHRNAILGRTSTAEEVAFLKLPGSGF